MACSPDGTEPLLNCEQEEIIQEAVGDLEELVRLLADQAYHVVYLYCHGVFNRAGDAGFFVMEDESGGRRDVAAHELADALMGRPSARPLFDRFVEHLRSEGITVATGRFGAYMELSLVNSGPVTLIWSDP